MKLFCKNILYLRKSKGLKQDEMQSACGVTRGTWSNYENEIVEPNLDALLRISQFFGIDINTLLTIDLNENGKVIDENKSNENVLKGKGIGKEIGKVSTLKPPKNEGFTFQLPEPKDGEEAAIWYILQQVRRLEREVADLKDKINDSGHSSQ